ncbi:MAG: CoA transferase subunit A [Chloroflexi bacterium]|nr:CoA transferase subunit A [Chloroflexota bacterium]
MAIDKRLTMAEAVAELHDGATIGIGGSAGRRKPMALVRAIARSSLKDLTVVCWGGPDLDLLIGAGKVKKAAYAFCRFEGGRGAPGNFRRARQQGSIEFMELSEYLCLSGLEAAGRRLPFFPVRSALGTDILTTSPQIQTFTAPYTGETLVAMPALNLDAAFILVNAADPSGYGQVLGDLMFDMPVVHAAKAVYLCADKVVPLEVLKADVRSMVINRMWVAGVVEVPFGGHPASNYPSYLADMEHLREHYQAAADPQAFKAYLDKYVYGVDTQEAYLERIGGVSKLLKLTRRDEAAWLTQPITP